MVLAAVAGLAPGCTLLDEILPGTPFTPDQPVAEVTVQGRINIDRSTGSQEGCPAGRALLWGVARNTGDLLVDDVFIEIDALDSGKRVLDTYRVHVFNGEVTEIEAPTPEDPEATVTVAGTSLIVDQLGSFEVCTRQAYGSVAGTAHRTDFNIVEVIE